MRCAHQSGRQPVDDAAVVAVLAGQGVITIMLDDDILEHFRARAEAEGSGYQTMINAALRAAVADGKARRGEERPLTVATLRKVLREELRG